MTRHAFCESVGYSFAQMRADGLVPVVSRLEVDYRTPLRSGDVMLSRLRLPSPRGPRFIFHQDIYNKATGDVVIKAVVTIVAIENGRVSRGERFSQALTRCSSDE
jgi:acyl-CoA thioester hydrolase